jgi:FtsH-binding integral membrane protein
MADKQFFDRLRDQISTEATLPRVWVCAAFALMASLCATLALPWINESELQRDVLAGFLIGLFLSILASAYSVSNRRDVDDFRAEVAGWVFFLGVIGCIASFFAGVKRTHTVISIVLFFICTPLSIVSWVLITAMESPPRVPVVDRDANPAGLSGANQ